MERLKGILSLAIEEARVDLPRDRARVSYPQAGYFSFMQSYILFRLCLTPILECSREAVSAISPNLLLISK